MIFLRYIFKKHVFLKKALLLGKISFEIDNHLSTSDITIFSIKHKSILYIWKQPNPRYKFYIVFLLGYAYYLLHTSPPNKYLIIINLLIINLPYINY